MSLPVAGGRHDAYSFWADADLGTPVIAIFRGVPPDRLRFSVAHELGHLILHRAPTPNVEREAHLFASHFLIPDEAAQLEFPSPLTLTDAVRLKARWGVAMQAVVMAAERAGVTDAANKRRLFQQISRRGWRKSEPGSSSIALEQPRGLCQMVELLYGSPPDVRRVSTSAGLPFRLVEALLDQDVILASLGEPAPHPPDRDEDAVVMQLRPRQV